MFLFRSSGKKLATFQISRLRGICRILIKKFYFALPSGSALYYIFSATEWSLFVAKKKLKLKIKKFKAYFLLLFLHYFLVYQ
jgi:hypothetical protein